MKTLNSEQFTILVVDDLVDNLQLVCSILEKNGYLPSFVNSGDQVLEFVQHKKPDIILLDLMMPEMNGFEVCQKLKEQPEYCDIPIIFLTASNDTKDIVKAFDVGAVDYIKKPFIADELLARVATHLELKQAKDNLQSTLKNLVKARDSALNAVHQKNQFFAKISHDIRTPISSIIGVIELLRNTFLDKHQAECIEILENSGQQLLDLVNDFIQLFKLQSSAVILKKEQIELKKIIEEVKQLGILQSEYKPIEIKVELAPNLPKYIIGDRAILYDIFRHLISNAIKFTEKGEIKITVSLQEEMGQEPDHDCPEKMVLKFSVTDTGIGISENENNKIFDAFTQVFSSYKDKYGGTGLGLAICQHLVSLMGGKIHCESQLSQGSCFEFIIPFLTSEEEIFEDIFSEKELRQESSQSSKNNFRKVKALLVEDNIINQRVIMMQIKKIGCSVDCVENGQQALEKLAQETYDLVFLDISMPIMDGYATISEIRSLGSEIKNIPVIGLTANATLEDKQKCLDSGMNDYLSKPVSIASLSAMLEKWIDLEEKNKPSSEEIAENLKLIDFEYLDMVTEGNFVLKKEILSYFLRGSEGCIAEIKNNFKNQKPTNVLQYTHSLKATSVSVGTEAMISISSRIEQAVVDDKSEEIMDLIDELEETFQKMITVCEQSLNSRNLI